MNYFYDKIVNYFFSVEQAKYNKLNDVPEQKQLDLPIFTDNRLNKSREPCYLNSTIVKDFKQLLKVSFMTYCDVHYYESTHYCGKDYGIATFTIPIKHMDNLLPLLAGFKYSYLIRGQYVVHKGVSVLPFEIILYY
jgi:hypothetical protein